MRVRPFVDSSPHLHSHDTLREIGERDGFLYFHNLVPQTAVLDLRNAVLEYAAEAGWLDPNADRQQAIAMPGRRIGAYQDDDWIQLQVRIQSRGEMWALGDHPAIHEALRAIAGGCLQLTGANTCRAVSPHPDMATKPHQDAHYFRLLDDFWTVWMPLGDCPREHGPLALLAGSHREGLLEHGDAGVPAHRHSLQEWSTSHYSCGDAVMFRPHTLHCSLPNLSGTCLRLSADFRYGFWEATSPTDWRLPHRGNRNC